MPNHSERNGQSHRDMSDWRLWPHPALYLLSRHDDLELYWFARAARGRAIARLICGAARKIAAVAHALLLRRAES